MTPSARTFSLYDVAAGKLLTVLVLGVAGVLAASGAAHAERVENKVAVFAALDKVTARISKLEVPLNTTVQFGSLNVTPRVCFSRSTTETPKTSSFVEVEENMLDGKRKRLFDGWMFAESPGLHAVEHPVFDVWLTGCQQPEGQQAASEAARGGGPAEEESRTTRRRVRR